MTKYYIQNGEKHSKRNCKCVGGLALFKLNGKYVNETHVGFWECKNCSTKQPYKPHTKFFNLIEERS